MWKWRQDSNHFWQISGTRWLIVKRLKAVHFDFINKDDRKVRKYLDKLYSSASIGFPLEIFMRLVAKYKDIKDNTNNIKKIVNLWAKQDLFLQVLDMVTAEDLLNLDVLHSTLSFSLREMIMGRKLWDVKHSNIFHAFNESWKGDRFIFRCIPYHDKVANMIVDELIPYLRLIFGDKVLYIFTPDACLEKED